MRASEPALAASGPGSGRSSRESFAFFDRDSSSWKTSQLSVFGGWVSFSETWPCSGMMRNGYVFLLRLSVGSTGGTGYSLWPTPTTSDSRRLGFSLKTLRRTFASREPRRGRGPSSGNLVEHMADEFERYPHPEFVEWLMGFPPRWTETG